MSNKHEYNNMTHNGSACAYSTLQSYNQGAGVMAPMPAGVPSMKTQIVPVYGGMGYDSLNNGKMPSCNGHFTISNAYAYPSGCTKYTTRLCQ